VFDSATAKAWADRGEQVVLVRKETNPDDLEGMIAAAGILTARGGKTSHAAVVARGMGTTCVCGAEALDVDAVGRTVRVGTVVIAEGDEISIDGSTGEIFLGAMPVVPSPVQAYIESGPNAALDGADEETAALVDAVNRLLTHADARRHLLIRANADTAEDAARARCSARRGSACAGPSTCSSGDRRVLIERVILAGTPEERDASLAALLTLQRKDFSELLDVMDGLPVNIRLLDPPLHEFLPDRTELAVRVAVAEARGESGPELEADRKVLAAVENLHESNPMLGLRGVRLGLVTPGLFALQVRAIGEAASDQIVAGMDPRVEIMVPLVGSVMELHLVRDEAERILAEVATEKGVTLQIPIGTMIELPRGAHRTPDRRGRGLLLVRHQRPDADDVGLLPR
jgi:pyruvate,orthophosphate dikinase